MNVILSRIYSTFVFAKPTQNLWYVHLANWARFARLWSSLKSRIGAQERRWTCKKSNYAKTNKNRERLWTCTQSSITNEHFQLIFFFYSQLCKYFIISCKYLYSLNCKYFVINTSFVLLLLVNTFNVEQAHRLNYFFLQLPEPPPVNLVRMGVTKRPRRKNTLNFQFFYFNLILRWTAASHLTSLIL